MHTQPPTWMFIRLFCILVFSLLIWFVNRKSNRGELSFSLGVLWTSAFGFGLLIAILPSVTSLIAQRVGVLVPSNVLFFGSILFLTILCFGITLKISSQGKKIIRLTQELGIINSQLETSSRKNQDQ